MQKKFKKLTACVLVTMMCLSATMPCPVHATEIDQNADIGETQELDENAVSIGDTDTVENETNVQEAENNPEPEQNVTEENEVSDDMVGTAPIQDKSENVLGSEPVIAVSDNIQPLAANNAGSFNVTGGSSGSDWVYDNSANTLTFKNGGNYTVTGDGKQTKEQIVIGANITITIKLSNVNCQSDYAGMNIDGSSNVILDLIGSNTFISGNDNNAGIEFNDATGSLTIKGSGSLTATGGKWGAGIGGRKSSSGKNIYITGGNIAATGGIYAAGIGGGYDGSGENININAGTINALSQSSGAGIGGGYYSGGINITINGGTITASSKGGAAIGTGGGYASTSNIKITGGKVIANGGYAGIGAADGSGQYITISGGEVIATGAAGIGSGGYSSSSSGKNITISGGTVTAKGINIDIGGHDSYFAKNIIISGGSVNAKKFNIRPTNDAGVNVYCAKLDNQSGVNKVTVDGNIVTRNGDHPDGDTAFYLYLTGEQAHDLSANGVQYKAIWDQNNSSFSIQPPAPAVDIDSQTASTITVKEPADVGTYGNAQYRIDGGLWQDSKEFKDLKSDTLHTIEVKYAGNNSFTESDIGKKEDVNTTPATYTITIPQETLTAGNESSKNEISVDTNNFDLGYGGKVDVKVSKTGSISYDGKLTLTRQQATGNTTITSALLVNEIPFTDINNPVATFTMDNKDSEKVSISFAKPTETDILAGTYSGTVTFEVSYSEP